MWAHPDRVADVKLYPDLSEKTSRNTFRLQ